MVWHVVERSGAVMWSASPVSLSKIRPFLWDFLQIVTHHPRSWMDAGKQFWMSECTNIYISANFVNIKIDIHRALERPQIAHGPMATTCRIGAHDLTVGPGKEVQLMRPATELLGQKGLQQRLRDDGYLYLQQVLPRDLVAAARKAVLAALESSGMVLKGENGKLNPEANCATDQGAVPASLARSPEMLALVKVMSWSNWCKRSWALNLFRLWTTSGCELLDTAKIVVFTLIQCTWTKAAGKAWPAGFLWETSISAWVGFASWVVLTAIQFRPGKTDLLSDWCGNRWDSRHWLVYWRSSRDFVLWLSFAHGPIRYDRYGGVSFGHHAWILIQREPARWGTNLLWYSLVWRQWSTWSGC